MRAHSSAVEQRPFKPLVEGSNPSAPILFMYVMPLTSLYANDFQLLMPILFMVLALSALLLYGSVVATDGRRGYPVLRSSMNGLRLGSLVITGLLCFNLPTEVSRLIQGRLVFDQATLAFWGVLTLFTFIALLGRQARLASRKLHAFEARLLVLLAWVGMAIIVRSSSFLSLYLGLELQALSFYVLAGLRRTSSFRTEAALKYFLLGAFTSGILLFGMSLLYTATGRLQYEDIARLLWVMDTPSPTVITGRLFVLVAMLFKMGAAPFHMWVPDVYEGRPTPVTTFFATVPKLAVVLVILRLCQGPFRTLIEWWRPLLVLTAMTSLAIAMFGALRQRKTKRFLAYRSIGHAGYLLLAISTGTLEGTTAAVLYVVLYVMMSAILWIRLMRYQYKDGSLRFYITDLKGMSRTNGALAFTMSAAMFSMAGIPPLVGFLAKGLVLFRAIEAGRLLPALFAVLTAVVAAFYYLRWIKIMYFEEVPADSWLLRKPMSIRQRLLLALLRTVIILLLAYPEPLLVWRQRVALRLVR